MKLESICLRPPILSDAPEILKWENDPNNIATSGNTEEFDLIDIENLIRSFENKEECDQFRYIIVEKRTDRLLGAVDVFEMNNRSAKVGILIANKTDRRKGIAKRSLEILEQKVKIEFGINHLISQVSEDNIASIQLFKSVKYQEIDRCKLDLFGNGHYIKIIVFEKWLNA